MIVLLVIWEKELTPHKGVVYTNHIGHLRDPFLGVHCALGSYTLSDKGWGSYISTLNEGLGIEWIPAILPSRTYPSALSGRQEKVATGIVLILPLIPFMNKSIVRLPPSTSDNSFTMSELVTSHSQAV